MTLIHRGYRYRLYPTAEQRTRIARFIGCARFVYNNALDARIKAYQEEKRTISYNEAAHNVTLLKKEKDTSWLKECDSMALQESLKDLDRAYQNFFDGRAGFPKFHARRDRKQSYRTRNQEDGVRIEDKNHITLPKLGRVRAKVSRIPQGRILNATVSRTPSGKFFVSLCVEEELIVQPNGGGLVGVDVGVKDFCSDSDGGKVANPRTLAGYEKSLAREQRRLSRMLEANVKERDSKGRPVWKRPLSECKNIHKQRLKVARIHEKIANTRADFLHKLSKKLASENQVIGIESLNVKGMLRNRRLAKHISDASWGKLFTMLDYKAEQYGSTVVKVPTFFPSSQTCSCCGYKNPLVKDLSVREWTCPVCGTVHDRDGNAAKNILNKAIEILNAA